MAASIEGWDGETLPWRAAQSSNAIEGLAAKLSDPDATVVRRSWECLLETRTDMGWRAALAALGSRVADDHRSRTCLDFVGLDPTPDGYRTLFPERTAHIVFPEGFLRFPRWGGVDGRLDHPTWQLPGDVVATGSFGGSIDEPYRVCGQALHRLVSIDDADILAPRHVVTCLSCVGWSEPILFFRHDGDHVRPADSQVVQQEPEFPAEPLPETRIRLVETPPRWQLQNVAISNSRENLNRVGGEPTWVQAPDYLPCPDCRRRMTFAMQLDSLDIEGDGPWWLWGSGGVLYVLWCADCSITATFWQCT